MFVFIYVCAISRDKKLHEREISGQRVYRKNCKTKNLFGGEGLTNFGCGENRIVPQPVSPLCGLFLYPLLKVYHPVCVKSSGKHNINDMSKCIGLKNYTNRPKLLVILDVSLVKGSYLM